MFTPFVIGTIVLLVLAGMLVIFDRYLVGALIVQVIASIFFGSMVAWALWVTGNVIIISFFIGNHAAITTNVLVAFSAGPVIGTWFIGRKISANESRATARLLLAASASVIGAVVGLTILSDSLAAGPSTTHVGGIPEVYGTWLGALTAVVMVMIVTGAIRISRREEP